MEATAIEYGPAHVVFLTVGLATFFFMAVWVIGVIVRLKYPEETAPMSPMPVLKRRIMAGRGEAVPVGVREIREDQRARNMEEASVEYDYAGLPRQQVPAAWERDLYERRN
jgi:hypothetical protein